jgi:hypothetical protein
MKYWLVGLTAVLSLMAAAPLHSLATSVARAVHAH